MKKLYAYIMVTYEGYMEDGNVMVSPIGCAEKSVRFPVKAEHIYSENSIIAQNDNSAERQKMRETMFFLNGVVAMLLMSGDERDRDIANVILPHVHKLLNPHKDEFITRNFSQFRKEGDNNDRNNN